MREILLHDTRSGALTALEPREDGRVGMYVCGPTVYGRIHVGNARPYVVFALLARFLEHEGLRVRHVSNVTDVNDKIYDAARALGAPSAELAAEMTAHYEADTDRLGLGRPDAEPRASEAVGAMVGLIEELIAAGHAYAADGDVYFRVRSWPGYGQLSHRELDLMDQGEPAARKEDALDFALWKAHKPGEDTAWEAPWGRGRPGWHIECSAMAEAELGGEVDIHGGGSDLVFPHHENEEAQTAAARGRPLARLWVHNGMVRLREGADMHKSAGNVLGLADALDAYGRDALVMYFCGGHYRQPLDFGPERLQEARARVARVREAARRLRPGPGPPALVKRRERFFAALARDFNTPAALGELFDAVREINRSAEPTGDAELREMLDVLGLAGLLDAAAPEPDAAARTLLHRRQEARAARDWAQADALRVELRERGWEVRDGPGGAELRPVGP